MAGHPALAHLIAQQRSHDLRMEAANERLARSFRPTEPRKVSLRLGHYRLTVAREVADAGRDM